MAQSLSQGRDIAIEPPIAARRARPAPSGARWNILLVPLLFAGLSMLAVLAGLAAYEYHYAGLVYPGVQVAGISLEGKTFTEAESAIREGLTPYPGPSVTLRYGERTWLFTPAELGVAVDSRATAIEAFAVGRSGSVQASQGQGLYEYVWSQWQGLVADLSAQWQAQVRRYPVAPHIQVDEGKVTYALLRIARDIDTAPREAELTVAGLQVVSTAGSAGRQVDVDATRAALLRVARLGQGGAVSLVVQDRQPMVASVAAAAEVAKALLSQPLALVAHGTGATHRFAVDRAMLRQWLQIRSAPGEQGTVDLQAELDREQVKAYLQQLAAQVDRPVRDAMLDFDPQTGQLSVLAPSQTGEALNVDAGVDAVALALAADGSSQAAAQPREVDLPITIVQPKIDSSKTAEMGIVGLVSQGTTTFAGSSKERVHNIVTAASKFTNAVVPPGEDFSFNKYVGSITAANGFDEGLVIAGDRTAVGVGGGVCQVSTTAFRAALNGGFPITQRYAHGYVVSWYGKPGLDATISTPDVDFRFRNDTGHYILVKSSVDEAKGQITFFIYGTPVDRTVEIGDPVTSNPVPAPAPLYQEDKSLPTGTIKQVDWAVNGLDAVVVRKVHNPDGTTREDTFKSHYQPWRAIYLYGPGTDLSAAGK